MRIEEIIYDYEEVKKFANDNKNKIFADIEKKCVEKKFIVGCVFLGRFSPNLLNSFLIQGYKPGMLLNKYPNKPCDLVLLNNKGELLALIEKDPEPKFEHEAYYLIEYKGYKYYLYTFDGIFQDFGTSFRAKYNSNNQIEEWVYISKGNSFVYQYFYDKEKVRCEHTILKNDFTKNKHFTYIFSYKNNKVEDLREVTHEF
jgi:hypothetical protein